MRREEMLRKVRERAAAGEPWDIAVIGGGATGVGVAVDAAARGFDVVLVEAHDFGKGTSSRSTKLVHGGVRYLEQGNIPLVMSALKERGLSAAECSAPGTRSGICGAELFVVGSAVLRDRLEALRPACGQVWFWAIEASIS